MKITDTLSGYLHIPVCATFKRKFLSICGGESILNKRKEKLNIDYTLYHVYFSVNLRFFEVIKAREKKASDWLLQDYIA